MSLAQHPRLRAGLLAAAILATPLLAEARRLDPQLESLLPVLDPGETIEVVVSFHGDGPLDDGQRTRLQALGLAGISMRALPIVGTRVTPAQLQSLLAMDDVRSVWLNAPLDLDNREATQLTGVDSLRDDASLRVGGLPVTGRGIGVVVNDSGVDGTHPDLKFPEHVRQNVLAQTNLYSLSSLLPITYQEGVANTDLGGGHGTHVAGTIGGNGAASPGGAFEGVAPGAGIIGYGSGAGLFVLDTIGGFDYALTHQAQYDIRVISNSFGNTGDVGTAFDPDDPTNIATKALADRGVVVVFSAGNSGAGEATITGNFKKAPWVVTVAAGDKQGRLADFSSRGEDGRGGQVEIDGVTYTWEDRPTVTAPGVDIVSTRASLGAIDKTSAEQDVEVLGPALAASYTHMSGTSMAAPHVSGIVALMLEADPSMDWRDVKRILQETASNIPGRAPWEVGAGYVNAHAAVQASMAGGNFGSTVNAARSFNANARVSTGGSTDYTLDFSPVGAPATQSFEVGADISMIFARANVGENTVAIALTDPNGKRYGSSIALPVLGENIAVSAPGVAGTWTLSVRGIGSVSGVALDPAQVTNGYGAPGPVDVNVKQLRTDGYDGLIDIDGHPARSFIEYGVSRRLVDGYADGRFRPDQAITRGEMADYLTMGAGIRQSLPSDRSSSFSDLGVADDLSPFAEAVTAKGAAQRDVEHRQAGVMGTVDGMFRGDDKVTRASLAYSLVQSLGLQSQAREPVESLSVLYDGQRLPIDDADAIAPSLRGYVQIALDLQLINARFVATQGPFDLQPTLRAYFDPKQAVTRGAFAAAASRLNGVYQQ
ncbi:S8 family serine peptidase [Marilutibacter maris]|uniref:Peptidase S8 n=1 Tax=Marilutibacter maris TaxID=1605891 RepID=A0A2U9T2Q6_9GAMM|nr:S8 family serine peptidase [Lysobacter maris]AWV06731.1 peptidase S8 [Lysobacter maris]